MFHGFTLPSDWLGGQNSLANSESAETPWKFDCPVLQRRVLTMPLSYIFGEPVGKNYCAIIPERIKSVGGATFGVVEMISSGPESHIREGHREVAMARVELVTEQQADWTLHKS